MCWSIIQSIVRQWSRPQTRVQLLHLADLGRQTHSAIPDDIRGTCPTLKTDNCVCRTQRLNFVPWYTVLVNCPCNLRRRQVQLQWILYVVAICVYPCLAFPVSVPSAKPITAKSHPIAVRAKRGIAICNMKSSALKIMAYYTTAQICCFYDYVLLGLMFSNLRQWPTH